MTGRGERNLEMGIETTLARVNDLKTALNNLILKIELDHENFTFLDAMDSFAVISGQMNSLMKILKRPELPPLREVTAIPLLLNPDRDPDLLALTEGRLEFFNHAVVPDYLRTKPDPEAEKEHEKIELRGSTQNPDTVNKNVATFTKMVNHMLEILQTHSQELDSSSERAAPPTSSVGDTQELVSSIFTGKAFRMIPPNAPIQRQGPTSMSSTVTPPQAKGGTVKTTIKPAGRNY